MGWDYGPSIFVTERTLKIDNEHRRAQYENDELKSEQARIEAGCKPRHRNQPDAGHHPFTHDPVKVRSRRDTAKRDWVPHRRKRENAKDRAARVAYMLEAARLKLAAG